MLDSMIDFVVNGGKIKITKPIFMKEFTKENNHLDRLMELQDEVQDSRTRKLIERDINFLKAGIRGEANVVILLLETKKLTGDIEINRDGDFIRLFKSKQGKVYKREGIYSPIAQNERHVRVLDKDIC